MPSITVLARPSSIATPFALAIVLLAPAASYGQSVGVSRGVFDAREASLASAGSVVGGSTVSALAWNPASLAFVETREVSASLAAAAARGNFTNRVDASGTLEGSASCPTARSLCR